MRKFPRLTAAESVQVSLLHTLPGLARGVAAGRPRVDALLERLEVDRRMVELFDRLRRRYNGRPVWVGGPAPATLLVLSPRYVERVLGGSDQLYTLDESRKHRMFRVFQPDGLIVSRGQLREHRRAFNESILDFNATRPSHADDYTRVVAEEIDALLDGPGSDGVLDWPELRRGFDRVSRRIVCGFAAREDVELTRALARLRRAANTAGILSGRQRLAALRQDWDDRVARYAESAPGNSLIGRVTDTYAPERVRPLGQVPHWMMSLDFAAAVAARTLALLASHPTQFARVNEELAAADAHHGPGTAASVAAQPFLEACVLEAARLWPPVPDLVRATTRPVDWDGVILRTDTAMVISSIHQHRSAYQGHRAHRFVPEIWLNGGADRDWSILPFSLGRGTCAGAVLGTHLAAACTAAVLRRVYVRLAEPALAADRPLPWSLRLNTLRFTVGDKPPRTATLTNAAKAAASGP